ncbi:MAG: polysaccharide deacetylase family protein [Armatimonadetes bacterium]|nr:polysaccharide deacetylase family protein [Armatimonadota bacterium]
MRLSKTVGVALAVIAVGLLLYGVEAVRVRGEAGGLSKSISPAYWLDRAAGRDLFDPDKRIFYKGVRERNEVCITFDDGPHPLSCLSILSTLKEKKVTATFFVVGRQVDGNPDLVKLIAQEGHEIGNHTYDHVRLDKLTREQVYDQIDECDKAVERATGLRMVLFRPPGMRYSDTVLSVVHQKQDLMVHWVIGAKDFIGTVPSEELTSEQQKMPDITPEKIIQYVEKQLRPGAIILLHDNPVTAAALPKLIDMVRSKGYEFKSCQEMMSELPQHVVFDPNPPATATATVVSHN